MTYNTLYNMVNLLLGDVILVNLGFLFLRLKERQIHIGRIDLVWENCHGANQSSGETTRYRNSTYDRTV